MDDAEGDFRPCPLCDLYMTPGPVRRMGRDDRGENVWMRRWTCAAGHWFTLEYGSPKPWI